MSDPKPVLTPLDGWDCPECHMGPALSALRAEVERLKVLAERPHWTPEQIDSINAEMADGIIHECIELLSKLPCHHGQSNVVTPPMMLREAILCSVGFEKAAREKAEAALISLRLKHSDCSGEYNGEIVREALEKAEARVRELEDWFLRYTEVCEGPCVCADCDIARPIILARQKEGSK